MLGNGDLTPDSLDQIVTIKRSTLITTDVPKQFIKEERSLTKLDAVTSLAKEKSRSCSVRSSILSLLPILTWLPSYKWKEEIVNDLVSGLTIAVMQIPQGMSYAILAGVMPVIGIYTAFFPVLVYVLMGTMPQVSMGTFAVVSIMVSKPVYQFGKSSGTNMTEVDEEGFTRLEVATAVTFMVGILQLSMGLLGCGCFTVVLTDVLVSAFNVGAAFHVFTSQVSYILGLDLPLVSGVGRLVKTYINVALQLQDANLVTLPISFACLSFLISYDRCLGPKIKTKFRYPLPTQLFLVVVFTALSEFLQLGPSQHVKLVSDLGQIPTGLPVPRLPPMELLPLILMDSIPTAIVAFVISQGMGCMFAEKYGYQVFPSQELIAEGASNLVGSIFSCITMSGAFSRSLVQEACGGRSHLSALFSALPLLSVFLYLGPYFQPLPVAVLAAIIIASLVGMFLKVTIIKHFLKYPSHPFLPQVLDFLKFWNRSHCDGVLWMVTFLSTVLLDVDIGLMVGVCFSVLMTLCRGCCPWVRVLKQSEESESVWVDKGRFKTRSSSIKIIQVFGSLNFLTIWFLQCLIFSNIDDPNESLAVELKEKTRQQEYILDLSNVTFMDSQGPGLVAAIHSKIATNEDKVLIVADSNIFNVFASGSNTRTDKCECFHTVMDAVDFIQRSKEQNSA